MERNDIQKISSETANIPVYKQSAEYAIEHDELPAYRESFRVNMACRDALESAIHESYHDYCLDTGKAAAQVAAQFGMERVAYVLANTVRAFDHDGRISRDNKAWAQTVPVCTDADEWGHERSRYFLVSQVNPGLVNLLVSRVREELAKENDACKAVFAELAPLSPGTSENVQKNPNLYEVRIPAAPTVYCECEFHDTVEGAKWIVEHTTEIGEAIAKGLCKYLGVAFVPAQTQKPAEEPKADAEQVLYRVQVGAFAVRANADRMLEKLKAAGFAGFVVKGKK